MEELNVLINQVPGKIDFSNFKEIKTNVEDMMALYEGAVFTEESKIPAKKQVAALRNIKDAIDTRRKDVKKKCLEPYNEFEVKANELMAIIDKPINLIDQQLVVFEQERKAKKKEAIKEIYVANIDGFEEYLPLDKIYDSRWENASTTIKCITEEINKAIDSTALAISTISGMNSESVPEALKVYKKNLSIADAIAYINDYEQKKAEILRREQEKKEREEQLRREAEQRRIEEQRRQEEQRYKEDARRRAEEEARAEIEAEAERQRKIDEAFIGNIDAEQPANIVSEGTAFETDPVEEHWIKLSLKANANDFEELLIYLNSVGIEYRREDD